MYVCMYVLECFARMCMEIHIVSACVCMCLKVTETRTSVLLVYASLQSGGHGAMWEPKESQEVVWQVYAAPHTIAEQP